MIDHTATQPRATLGDRHMSHTLPTRALAMAVGVACTIGTGWIVLDDIPAWSAITPKQYLSMLMLVVATFAAHRTIGDIMQRNYTPAVPVGVIAIAALAMVMIVSGGRYSQHAADAQRVSDERVAAYTTARVRAANALAALRSAHTAHAARIALADATVADAFASVRTACADGPGNKCRGAQAAHATAVTAAADVRRQTMEIDAADVTHRVAEQAAHVAMPAKVKAGDGDGFARLMATLGLVSNERAAAVVLAALVPFLFAVVVEFAAAACFVIAFPPANPETPVAPPVDPMPALRAVAAAVPLIAAPVAARADDVSQGVAKLVAVLDAKSGKELTVTQLAKQMRCCRPEASRRIKAAGALVATRKDGRYLYVTRA